MVTKKKKKAVSVASGYFGLSVCKIHIKGKGVSTHVMKTWENRGVHPLILNLVTDLRREVSCTPRPLYFQDLCSPYPLIGLGWRQSAWTLVRTHLALPRAEPRLVSRSCLYYDTI